MQPFEQVWEQTPMDIKLHELAREYNKQAEAFDRRVCTGPIVNGSIQPITCAERSLISRHSLNLLAYIYRTNPDVDHRALRREIARLS